MGFLAALSPFRHFVMGEEAMERAATEAETARIRALLREAIGGRRVRILAHGDAAASRLQGAAARVPARQSRRAAQRMRGCCANSARGTIEIALTKQPSTVSDKEYALLELLSSSSGRPVTWLNLRDRDDAPEAWAETLEKVAPLLERGCRPQVAARPLVIEFNLRNPFLFASMNSMKPAFGDKSVEAQKEVVRRCRFPSRVPRRNWSDGRF